MQTPELRRQRDRDLALRCVGGDAAAERALFETHRELVHGLLYRLMGSNRDIEDALQEVFFAVFRALSSYRGDALLATWIARITVRTGMRIVERQREHPTPHLELIVEDPASPASDVIAVREAARRIYRLLDDVEPRHRAAFLLFTIDERPIAEVAALTDASVLVTKLRIWRTRKRIEKAARGDDLLVHFLATEDT